MKTNLNRRLEALEGNLPAPQETEKARVHAQARMIVEEQEACDLVNQFFELVATNAPDEAIKPVALALLDPMDALESARVQG